MQKFLYSDLYDLEDTHWWHVTKRLFVGSLIIKYLKKNKNFKILDLGCGTGKNLQFLSQFGKVWGIDNSQDAIKFCKKRNLKNVSLGKAEITKFKKETFDLITALDVVEHTKDDNTTLSEINRILKPGGFIILTVPAFMWLWSKWDEILHHFKRYNRNSLEKVLIANHFKTIKMSYIFSYLLIPALVIRFIKSKFNKKTYSSDFTLNTRIINNIAVKIAKYEIPLMLQMDIPAGTSLLVLARKIN